MSAKNKKCQEIKNIDWVSSSFVDSFGNTMEDDSNNTSYESVSSPVNKKAKYNNYNLNDELSTINNDTSSINDNYSSTLKIWCDKYKPNIIDDLVVHKKKIIELEDWLKNVFNRSNNAIKNNDTCNKNNKLLLITGPTGCGKTCTLNVLCKNLSINIIEYITPIDFNNFDYYNNGGYNKSSITNSSKSITQSFDEFILRATKYSSLLSTSCSNNFNNNKKIVLIKDIPNTYHDNSDIFRDIIKKYSNNNNNYMSPLIFIISSPDIIRELFPDDFKHDLNITNINFNPITQTNIIKALNRILLLEIKNNNLSSFKFKYPDKDDLINIADTSDGDLRSAILKLQFNLDNYFSNNSLLFKKPKSLLSISSNNERIKVIKSSSKNKNSKICEIDKDKKIDFFNSIGRVLYPKKEFINDDINNYKFIYSPDNISDKFLTEPNKFINILHENYLDRFTKIKDVSNAALNLSISDLLLSSCWEGKDILVQYSLSTVTRSLMVSNTLPAPNKWKPLNKSKIWLTEFNKKDNLNSVRKIFPDLQSEKDILLDVIPYLKKLNVNLTIEQDNVITKIAEYK